MKLKKLIYIYCLIISTSISAFIFVSPANACSLENPCNTYAEVNSSGLVTNVIVCQASVCGNTGEWAGKNPSNGNSLVPQIAADPTNGENRGGYFKENQVYESNGIFTDKINDEKEITDASDNSKINTSIESRSLSFSFNDTINKNFSDVIKEKTVTNNNPSATVSVEKDNTKQVDFFSERKTKQEIENSFTLKNLTLLLQKIDIILTLLGTWVK